MTTVETVVHQMGVMMKVETNFNDRGEVQSVQVASEKEGERSLVQMLGSEGALYLRLFAEHVKRLGDVA